MKKKNYKKIIKLKEKIEKLESKIYYLNYYAKNRQTLLDTLGDENEELRDNLKKSSDNIKN